MPDSRCLVYTVAEAYPPARLSMPKWERYCELHGHRFAQLSVPSRLGVTAHWHRYNVFEVYPDFDRYLYVDADILVHWDCPDLFGLFPDPTPIHVVRDAGGLHWLRNAIETFSPMFPGLDFPWEQYFNSGVLLFSQQHAPVFRAFRRFRSRRWEQFTECVEDMQRQGRITDVGDQTLFNLFLAAEGVPVAHIPDRYNLQHLQMRGGFDRDTYVEMGWLWHLCGLGPERVLAVFEQILEKHGGRYARERPAEADPNV